MRDAETRELLRQHYKWWTLMRWWQADDRGLKLGPVTVYAYKWGDGWECGVTALAYVLYDSGLNAKV